MGGPFAYKYISKCWWIAPSPTSKWEFSTWWCSKFCSIGQIQSLPATVAYVQKCTHPDKVLSKVYWYALSWIIDFAGPFLGKMLCMWTLIRSGSKPLQCPAPLMFNVHFSLVIACLNNSCQIMAPSSLPLMNLLSSWNRTVSSTFAKPHTTQTTMGWPRVSLKPSSMQWRLVR